MGFRMPTPEIAFSFIVYVGSLFYAIYNAYQYGDILDVPENENSFTKGWTFLKRKRDDYDDEWESFVEHTRSYVYWYICHALLSEIVRLLEPHRLYSVHAMIGLLFVCYNFNVFVIGIMVAMVFTYYAITFTRKRYVWLLTVIWLIVLNMSKQSVLQDWLSQRLTDAEIYDAMIALSWLMLRLTSFGVDYCNAKFNPGTHSAIEMKEYFAATKFLGYAFYLPVYLHGPPLIYERYATMFARNHLQPVEESLHRLKDLLITLIRIGAVYLLNELSMHFIYANVVIYNPDLMQYMNLWTMYGFAYSMGQFFCNKYIVSYGLGIALAKFDRIDAPRMPMCIGRIHLYSHMWRYFDQGLHDFLFKHIYEELCSKTSSLPRKLVASSVSFIFIYLWHGYYLYLLAWVFLNLAFLYLELFGRHLCRNEQYNKERANAIGVENVKRFNAFFGSQLLIPSIITNLMFIGGSHVGASLAIRTYINGGFLNYILLSFVAYNFYQVSNFIFECEGKRVDKFRQKSN